MGGTVEGATAGIDELDVLHFRSMRAKPWNIMCSKKMREAAAALRVRGGSLFCSRRRQ